MVIPCPECGDRVSTKAPACPHCGYVLSDVERASAETGLPAAIPKPVPEPSDSLKLANGESVNFGGEGSGSNDIYDDYYTIEFRGSTLWVYSGDHDVAQYTEVKFNGMKVLDELDGPGTERAEFDADAAALAAKWADQMLEAAGQATGRQSFSDFCSKNFSVPGPTFARVYDKE